MDATHATQGEAITGVFAKLWKWSRACGAKSQQTTQLTTKATGPMTTAMARASSLIAPEACLVALLPWMMSGVVPQHEEAITG